MKKTSKPTRKTSKPRARKPVRCGTVEGPQIERGWICCACYKKQGVGVYNGLQRTECKQCGHERCKGTTRRQWDPPSPVAVPPDAVKGFLGAFVRMLGGMLPTPARMAEWPLFDPKPKTNDPDPAWEKACNEVVAAFCAAELRAKQAGRETAGIEVDQITRSVRSRLPRAMELYTDSHPSDAKPCTCRHLALIAAGAEMTAQAKGQDHSRLFASGKNVLDWYLSTRS